VANRHFGNIGDIWKHLPLAEILAIEKPARYWESHAGSAQYALTHSAARDYGVFCLISHAADSLAVASSSFLCLLDGLRTGRGRLATYPGSPRIAMELLGKRTKYLFCDIDGRSLATIKLAARRLAINPKKIVCVKGDGVGAVLEAAERLRPLSLKRTLVLVDPCAGDAPFARREGRPSPMDLFSRLASLGAKSILWYSFDSRSEKRAAWRSIRASLAGHGVDARASGLWCGEIGLKEIDCDDLGTNPGVRGCGILCANLGRASISASSRLGYDLARLYADASFPGGMSGALAFRGIDLDVAVLDNG
jgi:23S rRNA A2030 N6-methylase RlmJ